MMRVSEVRAPLSKVHHTDGVYAKFRQAWIAFWWVICMPLDCIDLKTGLPDHDRLSSTAIGVVFGIKVLTMNDWPPVLLSTAALAAIFGPRMFKQFLVRAKLGATDVNVTQTVHTVTEIIDRRKEGGDVEPTP